MTATDGRHAPGRWNGARFEQAQLVAVNELRAVTLIDAAVTAPDGAEGPDFYVSGNRTEVSTKCAEEFPDVWTAISDAVSTAVPDRVVLRVQVGPTTPGRSRVGPAEVRPSASSGLPASRQSAGQGLFGSLYAPSDRGRIDAGGLVHDMRTIESLRQLWELHPVDYDGSTVLVRADCPHCGTCFACRVDPGALPNAVLCTDHTGSGEGTQASTGLPRLTLDELRLLVDSGLFGVLYDAGRGSSAGTYDTWWKSVLIEENTRRQDQTFVIPPDTPLPRTCPERLGFVARSDTLYGIAATSFSLPRTPAMEAFTEVCYGYLWCMFDNGVTCEECIVGLSAQSMYATFAEYYHFRSDVNESLGELSRATASYIQHCLTEHPDSALCQVMDSFVLATQAVYLDVLQPKATELRFGNQEMQALRYRMLNSGARTITLLNLLEGNHRGVVTDDHLNAVTVTMFSVHDALDRRCDIRASESSNLFNIVAAHNSAESTDILGSFCADVLSWAVNKESMWPILAAGRFLLWQIMCRRYRSVEVLENLQVLDRRLRDPYRDQVLNSMNPLLEDQAGKTAEFKQDVTFSVRERCSNPTWYDQKIAACLAHFAACESCDGYDQAPWRVRAEQAAGAYLRKQEGDCGCVDTLATYNSLVLLENVWWAASSAAEYTGPTDEWNPFLV